MRKTDKAVYSFLIILLLAVSLTPAIWGLFQPTPQERYADLAVYDRHNGGYYSCNEINADLAYYSHVNTHNALKAARYKNELDKYCPGY